jgi:hypothetical protein
VTVPVGALEAVVVSATVTLTLVEQLDAPSAMVQPTVGCGSEVDVLSLPVAVTVMDAEGLVLVLRVGSPPYAAVMEPDPAVVPVNMTEQLVTPATVDRLQVLEPRLPPVLPGVNVNVTVPVGAFEGVVVSATVAVTEAVQLVPPNAMLQLTAPTLVEVLSLPVAVTAIVAAELVLVLCVVSPTYVAVTEPVPAAVPVNVTEQLVTPDTVDSVQLLAVREPPVVPAVKAKFTVPPGVFEAVVVSVTVAVTLAVQLVAPKAMLQATFPTLVDVVSFATVIVFDVPILPL